MKGNFWKNYKYHAIALILGITIAIFSIGFTFAMTDVPNEEIVFNIEDMNEEDVIYKLLDNVADAPYEDNEIVSFEIPELKIEPPEIVIAEEDEKEDPTNVVNIDKGVAKETTVEEAKEKYENNEQSIGIDVSTFQGKIDWKKVKQEDIKFAMIRVGFRGYSTGKIMMDNRFYENIQGALANNINVGIYFFSGAINEAEAEEEALWVLEAIKDYEVTYPIAIDLEIFGNREDTRLHGISDKQITDVALAFSNKIKEAGYTPMIYSYLNAFNNRFEVGRFKDTRVWLAHYADKTTYKGNYHMWQYTSDGSVAGIDGRVDMNISYFSVTNDITKRESVTGLNENQKGEEVTFIECNQPATVKTKAVLRTSPSLELPNKAGEIEVNERVVITGVSDNFVRIVYKDNILYTESLANYDFDLVKWDNVNINKDVKIIDKASIYNKPYVFAKEYYVQDITGIITILSSNTSTLKIKYNGTTYYMKNDPSLYTEDIALQEENNTLPNEEITEEETNENALEENNNM